MTKEELEKEAEDKKPPYAFCALDTKCELWKDGYKKGAESREKRIAELEEKLANADYQLEGRDLEIRELKEQIKKMQNCRNCESGELSAHEEPCLHCQRCFASKDVTDQENVKDNWEAIKEIKEK